MSSRRVLFLCTGNSCRSQMAEGLLRHLASDRYAPLSAGTHPAGLNPMAVRAMREAGIDISRQRSKNVNEFTGETLDHVITVCDSARQSCPVFPGMARKTHWDVEDPASATGTDSERMEVFLRVRDDLRRRIEGWLANPT